MRGGVAAGGAAEPSERDQDATAEREADPASTEPTLCVDAAHAIATSQRHGIRVLPEDVILERGVTAAAENAGESKASKALQMARSDLSWRILILPAGIPESVRVKTGLFCSICETF